MVELVYRRIQNNKRKINRREQWENYENKKQEKP